MTKPLLYILFFTLPFIHGKILPTLGIDLYISIAWNFEFTKAAFFNIFCWFIFIFFLWERFFFKKEVHLPRNILLFLWVLWASSFFSLSAFTSIIGDSEKWHTTLLFFNLIWIFIILYNSDKKILSTLIQISILSATFISLLAIKELFFETYNYGELASRALGSFWHPNYLAWYLLLIIPLTQYCKNNIHKYVSLGILLLWIIFTQSVVAVCLALWYLGYMLLPYVQKYAHKNIIWWILAAYWLVLSIVLIQFFPEKLHSFLSRFYLWETTLKIIFSDIKIFLIGSGFETLPYYFNSFKVPEVYIYENFWYTADRPHNFFLNVFFHLWVVWVGLLLYFVWEFFKLLRKSITPEKISIVLFLLFWIFHFFSAASYLLIILLLVWVFWSNSHNFLNKYLWYITIWLITTLSIVWSYYSYKFYTAEIYYQQKNYSLAQETFSHSKYLIGLERYEEATHLEWITSQRNLKEKIISQPEREINCDLLTQKYPSVENYFYCWNIFDTLWKTQLSKPYYFLGFKKLPDLWNEDSPYWNNYFTKTTITGNRFFAPEFGDIRWVLEKVRK